MDPIIADPVVCEGTCKVTLVFESAPLTKEKALDLLDIFWAFVLVLVVVWGLRQIINIFTRDADA